MMMVMMMTMLRHRGLSMFRVDFISLIILACIAVSSADKIIVTVTINDENVRIGSNRTISPSGFSLRKQMRIGEAEEDYLGGFFIARK